MVWYLTLLCSCREELTPLTSASANAMDGSESRESEPAGHKHAGANASGNGNNAVGSSSSSNNSTGQGLEMTMSMGSGGTLSKRPGGGGEVSEFVFPAIPEQSYFGDYHPCRALSSPMTFVHNLTLTLMYYANLGGIH